MSFPRLRSNSGRNGTLGSFTGRQCTSSRLLRLPPCVASGQPSATIDGANANEFSDATAQRRASGAGASSSGRGASSVGYGPFQPYGSKLKLRNGGRPPGWLHLLDDHMLPQQLSEVPPRPQHQHDTQQLHWDEAGTAAAEGSEGGAAAAAASANPSALGAAGHHTGSTKDINRGFTKALAVIQNPTDMWSHLKRYSRQSEECYSPKGGSSSSKGQQGQGINLMDLDGRSLVGALVWLVKYADGHSVGRGNQEDLQQQHQQQQQEQEGWEGRSPSTSADGSSSSRSSKAGVRPPLRRRLNQQESRTLQRCAAALAHAAAALHQRHHQQQSPGGLDPSGLPAGFSAADKCSLVYVCAKLRQRQPQLVAAVAEELEPVLFGCSVDELFRLSWGLSSSGISPSSSWFTSFCRASQAKMFMALPRHLAIYPYALARMGFRPPEPWIQALLEVSQPWLTGDQGFNSQNLSNLAWALGRWRYTPPPDWSSDFLSAAYPRLSRLPPVAASQLLVGLTTMGVTPPPPWCQTLEARGLELLPDLELLHVCNLMRAWAAWGYRPAATTLEAVVAATGPALATATPTDLAALLSAVSRLGYLPQEDWVEAWMAAGAAALPRYSPQELAAVVGAFGRWGLLPEYEFMREFYRASAGRFPEFDVGALAVLLLGLSQLKAKVPNKWSEQLLSSFYRLLPTAKPHQVCLLVSGLAQVYVAPEGSVAWLAGNEKAAGQLRECVAGLEQGLQRLSVPQLLGVLEAAVKLGVRLEERWVSAHKSAAEQLGERATPEQRARFIRGYKLARAN